MRDWLPLKYAETQQYRWFRKHFGTHDFIAVSWPGCTLDDDRLDRFVQHLTARPGQDSDPLLIGEIHTGRSLLRLLTDPPVNLDRSLAIERLRGVVIGPDGRQTCAVVFLPAATAGRLDPAIGRIRRAAGAAGVPPSEVRLGGIPVVNDALNRESTSSLVRLFSLSGLLGLLIAWLCFRDPRLTALVLFVGVYSAALSLAVIPMTGTPLNAVAITMVPLVYVTAVSGAIHLTNYYLDALGEGDRGQCGRPGGDARGRPAAARGRDHRPRPAVAGLQRPEADPHLRGVLGGRGAHRFGLAVLAAPRRVDGADAGGPRATATASR